MITLFQKTARYSNKKSIFLVPTSTGEIFHNIMNLKRKDSCGNDNISAQILKHIYDILSPHLHEFENGVFLMNLRNLLFHQFTKVETQTY